MKPLALLCLILLASCGEHIPRAIIAPPVVVSALDVEPVAKASRATRDAVREVAAAGQASREAGQKVTDITGRLIESIHRAEAMAEANAETQALAEELGKHVMELTAAHALAEEKEKIALELIDTQEDEIAALAANSRAQAQQIRSAAAAEKTLREQVEALAANADKRLIAEEKLGWWRKAAGLTWAFLAVYLIIKTCGSAIAANLRLR